MIVQRTATSKIYMNKLNEERDNAVEGWVTDGMRRHRRAEMKSIRSVLRRGGYYRRALRVIERGMKWVNRS